MFHFKFRSFFILSLAVAVVFTAKGSRADTSDILKVASVEVFLGEVFIPETGYGTNNEIQITLDGYLPNSCYQLGKASVENGSEANTFVVHQFADLEKDGVCADGTTLPPHLANLIPYTYDVSLGHLQAGHYKIIFDQNSSFPRTRTFQVASSKNLSADDFAYAAVSTVSMPDVVVVHGEYHVKVNLIGTFTSSCSYIGDMKVTHEKDVIVVQPILGFRLGKICTQMLVPFQRTVDLGQFSEGRYLVHVRAMSGKSVSHAFTVLIPDPSIQ